ncbi:MAG: alpha/beta fold hydrolase [Thermoanaerobaculia bacterium]
MRPIGPSPRARAWCTTVDDPQLGSIELTGLLREEPGGRDLLVFVHGIGGSASARYAQEVARVAREMGLSCLRLNLRGCDRRAPDYYHAGLSSDLTAALADRELARFERLYLLGYSMGGHLGLRWAVSGPDPRLRAVAAICSPLDLVSAAAMIDRPGAWPYRLYVLRNLIDIYRAVASQREVPVPLVEANRFTHLRQWDDQVVAPRWGFDGADDYYAQASVAPHLERLAVPSLLVAVEDDPLVPGSVLRPALARRYPLLEARWAECGGHVGFPRGLNLGEAGPTGIEGQAIAWLLRHGR